jgi:hypothetical protein
MFACFDQQDLKAPFALHITAPPYWTVQIPIGLACRASLAWAGSSSSPGSAATLPRTAGANATLADLLASYFAASRAATW